MKGTGMSDFPDYSACDLPLRLANKIRGIKLIAFDFDGVFTDNAVYISQEGIEMVRCTRADGMGLEKLARLGIQKIVISTESNPVVQIRCRKLKIDCRDGCDDKLAVLTEELERRDVELHQVAFVGNDINDVPCLEVVGLPIIVQDAHPDVARTGFYRTVRRGGQGAVREVCDLFDHVIGENGTCDY